MKNIKHFFAAFLLLVSVEVSASDDTTLVLEMCDGSTANFLLAEKPKITFSGDSIRIVSEFCSVGFSRNNVRKYHFCEQVTVAVAGTFPESKATLEGNTLVISGVPENTTVTIYTTGGTVVKRVTAIDGKCSVFLNELVAGHYIVSFYNTTFKFLKR